MTKNKKAVLMHTPATGLGFYIRTRVCYCGVLNSSSRRTRSFPPPGFVCAFTLAHAIYSWCQISSTTEVRASVMSHWDFGKHLEGHSCTEQPGLGRQGGLWHCPTAAPWHPRDNTAAGAIYEPEQALLHPPQDSSLGGECDECSSEEPFLSLGAKGWAGGAGPCHPTQGSPRATPARTGRDPRPHWSHQGWQHRTQGADVGRKPSIALK